MSETINKYGEGSAGHVVVDIKKQSGYYEVWAEYYGNSSEPVRCWSIEQLNVTVQDCVKEILDYAKNRR